jgi:HEAT repeat protein
MSQLEDLLQQCTVKLTFPYRQGWGTGFFVAPGWVLTCAHVVQGVKEPIQIQWQSQENGLQAVVERSLPSPYDLALLRVTLPTHANPPCVYLDAEVEPRDPLYLFGYPDEGDRQGEPRTFNCDGTTGSADSILFNLGQVRPGMSGSPLLNQRTGKVCGIVKFTRDRSSDLGGGAIPTHVILEQFPELRDLQQEFHGSDWRWSDLLPTTNHQGTTLDTERVKSYLRSLCQYYEQWWNRYRLTEAISARQATFTFEQTVQIEETSEDTPGKKESDPWGLLQGIIHYAKSEHVLLVGSPGTGKTTALLRLWVVLAEQELKSTRPRIPVLVKLKDYQKLLSDDEDSSGMLTLIKEALEPELPLTISEIKTLLFQEKRLFLLLDGLNEIPAGTIYSKLVGFRADCDRAKIPLVCTTRSSGDSLGIQRRLNLQTLSDPEITRFLRECMPGQEEQILKLLNKDDRELGKTPFVLWMLYDISKNSDPVPESLGEAFRRFTGSYTNYKINQEGIPVSPEELEYWNLLLKYLAFEMLRSPDPHNPSLVISERQATNILLQFPSTEAIDQRQAQVLLKNLLKYHLLQRSHKGEVSFCHQLIQEYYAAEHLLQQLPTLLEDEDKFKREYLNYLKWTEAIALMLALVEEEALALRVIKLALHVDLRLGAKLAGKGRSAVQQQAIETINMLAIPEWLKVELLGITQSELVIPSLLQAIESENLDITQSAVTWLTNIGGRLAIHYLCQKLRDLNNLFREQKTFSLPDPKTELWIQIIKSLSTLSPADAISELHKKVFSSTFLTIFSSPEPEILLVKLDGINLIPKLFEIVDSQDCSNSRRRAVDLLGRIVNESVANKLIQALENETDSFVREGIIDALGKHCTKDTTMALIKNLGDQDHKIRRKVIENLVKQNSLIVIEELCKMLQHPNWEVGWCAAITLGMLHNNEAFSKLCEGLENSNKNIRRTAADILGELSNREAIPLLINALQDTDYSVRRSAAIALGKFGLAEATSELAKTVRYYHLPGEENKHIQTSITIFDKIITVPGLTEQELRALGDDDAIWQWQYERRLSVETQIQVAESLRKIATEEALKILFRFKDSGSQAAIIVLAELGKQEVILDLFEALINPEHKLTNRIINALASLSNDWMVEKLLTVLQNPNIYPRAEPYLCNRAAIVLCKIRVELTKNHLKDLNSLIINGGRKQILWAISEIQSNCKYYNHEIAHGLILQGQAIALFFSYAPKDEALQQELAKHLNLLERQGVISSWDSRQILPGDEREQVISQQLNTADIILLLISSDSIADNTCYDLEIKRAMERHQAGEAHVIPILLRPVDWAGAPFSQLDMLPKNKRPVTTWDNRDEAFRQIAEGIRAVAIELRREKGRG